MTLQSSPPISAGDINVELGRARGAAFSITGAEERALAGKPSGAISFSDFLGKSVPILPNFGVTYRGKANGTASGITIAFGSAFSGRKIVIGMVYLYDGTSGSLSLGSAAIAGVSASIKTQDNHQTSNAVGTAIFSATVSSGTSGSVTFSFSGGGSIQTVYLYAWSVEDFTADVDGFSAATGTGGGSGEVAAPGSAVSGGAMVAVSGLTQGQGPSLNGVTTIDATDSPPAAGGHTASTSGGSVSVSASGGSSGTPPFALSVSGYTFR